MSLTLHSAFVPTCLQVLGSMVGILDIADAYCKENDVSEEEVINSRLADDMFPFAYQVKSTVVHSLQAIQSLEGGVFSPDFSEPPPSFAGLKEKVLAAIAELEKVGDKDLEKYVGQAMQFKFKDYELNFTADQFLLSFSQPNFFFHATTAYDLLRMQGMPLGKRHFMGAMRLDK